jgi:hypothetical protein
MLSALYIASKYSQTEIGFYFTDLRVDARYTRDIYLLVSVSQIRRSTQS